MIRIGMSIFILFCGLVSTAAHAEESFQDCDLCPEMVPLPPGAFTMGFVGGRKAEAPSKPARITQPFAIARTEITFDQFAHCVDEGGCKTLPWDRDWGRGQMPAIYVTWDMAAAYALWLSRKTGRTYRLPTEVEWEYAAWGGEKARRTGDGRANCNGCFDAWNHRSLPAASFPPNGYGLHDMLGNVMEWTADCWRPTHHADAEKDCGKRTRKGGSWYFNASVSTPTYRFGGRLSHTGYDIGFRVVADLE